MFPIASSNAFQVPYCFLHGTWEPCIACCYIETGISIASSKTEFTRIIFNEKDLNEN